MTESRKAKNRHSAWSGFLPADALVMGRKGGRVTAQVLAPPPAPASVPTPTENVKAVAPAPLVSDSLERIISDLFKGAEPAAVAKRAAGCVACKLCQQRKNIVAGEGDPRARIVFVGEGPGEQEDLQGRPFIGPAGQLLTRMIEALGLRREDVYIANVVKCRPPGNRNPEPDEIEACSPFLERQLDVIKPAAIVALGKFAAQTLLKTDVGIMRLRGHFKEYRGIPVMPTFHPSYLLRTPEAKREAWDDLKQVAARIGHVIPERRPMAPGGNA